MKKKSNLFRHYFLPFIKRYTFVIIILFLSVVVNYAYYQKNRPSAHYLANNQHTNDFSNFNQNFSNTSWSKRNFYGYFISSPIIYDGIVYVSEIYGNTLNAIDIKTGVTKWSFRAEDDIPFSPAVTKNSIFITSTDGRLYSLDRTTGNKQWEYRIKNFFAIATSPVAFNNTIYFGCRDTYFYAINALTGKELWKFKTESGLDSTPTIKNDSIFFGGFDGSIYALNLYTGKPQWQYKTQGKIIAPIAEKDNVLYIGSRDSFMYAINSKTGRLLWKVQTSGPIETPASISNNILVFVNKKNTLFALDLSTHTTAWSKSFKVDGYTAAAIKDNTVYIGSSNGSMYAFDIYTGKEKWEFQTEASIAAAPSISQNTLFFTNRNGSLYKIDRLTGHSFTKTDFSVSFEGGIIQTSAPIEITVSHDSSTYQYPWLEASVSAIFKHGSTINHVDGFYYDTNTWKVRFTPLESGDWTWEITLAAFSDIVGKKTGSFHADLSTNEGFISLNSLNENRLALSNGNLFHPLGIQTCLNDSNDDGFFLNNLYIDGRTVDLDTYLKTYGKNGVGFNMFRWGVENCTFRLWYFNADFRQPERFLDREGIWADILMKKLKENGFHIMFTIFNSGPLANELKPSDLYKNIHYLDSYLNYIVARYSAYIDIWELLNESDATNEWFSYIVNYIHAVDPYHHPITTSWQKPKLSEIDITAPHLYQTDPLSSADLTISQVIDQNNYGKPIIFGELGNQGYNWDPESAIRMRVKMWTAFFKEAGVIFWDTSNTKTYFNKENSNIYFGDEERTSIKSFVNFIRSTGADIHPIDVSISNQMVRSYANKTNDTYYGYLYHYADQNTQTSTTVYISDTNWHHPIVRWIDPQSGKIILQTQEAKSLTQITSPLFSIDIAYTITNGSK